MTLNKLVWRMTDAFKIPLRIMKTYWGKMLAIPITDVNSRLHSQSRSMGEMVMFHSPTLLFTKFEARQ